MSSRRKNRGRPKRVNRLALEVFTRDWVQTLTGLRYGLSGFSSPAYPLTQIFVLRRSFKTGLAIAHLAVGAELIDIQATNPHEVDLLEKLSKAETAYQVRLACKQCRLWKEKEYIRRVCDKAEEFIRSKTSREVVIRPIGAEPKIWERLLQARTVGQVQSVAYSSKYWLNPKVRSGLISLRTLVRQPEKFLKAKADRRYPGSDRPTSEDRRMCYLAKALAYITLGCSHRTVLGPRKKSS